MANPTLQEQIKVLRDNYVAQLPQKISAIEEAWETLQKNHWNSEDLTRLQRLVHTLAGSGATFGVPEVSNTARAADLAMKALLLRGAEQTAEERSRIRPLLDALKREALEPQRTD